MCLIESIKNIKISSNKAYALCAYVKCVSNSTIKPHVAMTFIKITTYKNNTNTTKAYFEICVGINMRFANTFLLGLDRAINTYYKYVLIVRM